MERSPKRCSPPGKIHRALAFQTGIAVIGCSGFGLYAYGGAAVRFEVFQVSAVTVFPVVTVIEDTFESEFVVGADVQISIDSWEKLVLPGLTLDGMTHEVSCNGRKVSPYTTGVRFAADACLPRRTNLLKRRAFPCCVGTKL